MLAATLVKWRNRSRCSAHTNVVLGEAMRNELERVDRMESRSGVTPNWADVNHLDAATTCPQQPVSRDKSLRVVYAGNLGRAHEFYTLLARDVPSAARFWHRVFFSDVARSADGYASDLPPAAWQCFCLRAGVRKRAR